MRFLRRHEHRWAARNIEHVNYIVRDPWTGQREEGVNRKVTRILRVCLDCGDASTSEVDGHWELEDLLVASEDGLTELLERK